MKCERTGRASKGGDSPRRLFLLRRRPGFINGQGLYVESVWYPQWVVRKGGDPEKLQEDDWDNFLPLPHGWDPVRGGLQAADYGRGTNLPVLEEAMGPVT